MLCQANVCLEYALFQPGLNCLRTANRLSHDLPNSDLLLGKCLLILLQEGERVKRKWPRARCLVAATVEIQNSEVGFLCHNFGTAHPS